MKISATRSVITTLAILICAISPLRAQDARITGVVANGEGQPISGALVKVTSVEPGLAFMVVSQAQGQYRTPNLLPGKYSIQGFGGNYQSAPVGPVVVTRGKQGKIDLTLSASLQVSQRAKRMTDADYEKLMPEGRGKHEVVSHCTACHTLELILSSRKTRAKWRETVDRMADDLINQMQLLSTEMKEEDALESLLVDYLAKTFGPDEPLDPQVAEQLLPYPGGPLHPYRNLPSTLLKGADAKYIALEFSLPAGSAPRDIAVDSQGIAWISERNTGLIGRFDPDSLTYTRIASPPAKNKPLLDSIAIDSKDQVWFVDDGPNARILQYNPKSLEFNSYPIPDYPYLVPDTGAARITTLRFSNESVWATRTTAQRILKLDPSTPRISEYAVPRGSSPFGLAVGADKMIWYSAEIGNEVVRLDPGTGRLTPYQVPTPRSDLRGMAADTQGNLWIAATGSGKLLNIDGRTGRTTEYSPPTEESGPFALDVETKRNLIWFSEVLADRIGRFDPSDRSFVEFPLSSADLDVRRIEIDRSRPNRLWWSGANADKIGYIEVIE